MKSRSGFNIKFLGLVLGLAVNAAFGANVLKETAGGPDTAKTVVNAHGALMAFGGSALPGANVGLNTRISDTAPLYAGAELGVFVSTGFASYALFPMLGSLYYQFQPSAAIHPLLGLLAGPVFSTGGGYSTVQLGGFLRPGVNFELGEKAALSVETRIGVIGSTFVFMPEVGAIFPL